MITEEFKALEARYPDIKKELLENSSYKEIVLGYFKWKYGNNDYCHEVFQKWLYS